MSENGIYCHQLMKGMSISSTGIIRPCCALHIAECHAHLPEYSLCNSPHQQLPNFLNLELLTTIRKDLKNGIQSPICQSCWDAESAGLLSMRQIHNNMNESSTFANKWDTVSDEGIVDISSITYMDISLGNTCNLKCRSCNVFCSDQWIDEAENYLSNYLLEYNEFTFGQARAMTKHQWYIDKFNSGFFDNILPNIQHINFLGGEPLMVKEHYNFLSYIIDNGWSKTMSLSYNTNGTLVPDEILAIWKNFKNVSVGISIDATDELAYYVRYPSNWDVINKNVHALIAYAEEYTNIRIQIHTTVSVLNIEQLHTVINWNIELYKLGNFYSEAYDSTYGIVNALPHINVVDTPSYLHLRNIPNEMKPIISQQLEDIWQTYNDFSIIPSWNEPQLKRIHNLKSLVEQEQNKEEWELFIAITKESDSYRNVNILDYIPWMNKFI